MKERRQAMTNNSLKAAILKNMTPEPQTLPAEPVSDVSAVKLRRNKKAPSRANTVLIGGHFPPAIKQQLRLIAVEEGKTNQALLEEALNLLFAKKGKALFD